MSGGPSPHEIEQAAIGWVMALHEAPQDPAVRERLAAWLAADPAHRAAYGEARRLWLLTGLVPPQQADEPQSESPSAQRP